MHSPHQLVQAEHKAVHRILVKVIGKLLLDIHMSWLGRTCKHWKQSLSISKTANVQKASLRAICACAWFASDCLWFRKSMATVKL